jgi:peptidoglycan/LPS O-acetylase OafA/YrhL
MYPAEVEVFYCNTFTRMDSLLMGSLLAVHLRQGKTVPAWLLRLSITAFIILISASLLIFGNVRQDNAIFPTIGYSISAMFFTSVLSLILKNEHRLTSLVKHLHPIKFIGRISYGMYVYHIPIYLVLSTTITNLLTNYNTSIISSAAIISILSLILTIAASTLSFYYIEQPILKLKKHFP